ncbi:MAG: AAA family ATPase, partial [Clostridia bacterium]|nr:AAA family ATPase [Clostridia bacterium]
MKELSIREAAAQWDVSPRRVQQMCKEGKIAGARKEGRTWLIPGSEPAPVRAKTAARPQLLPLPVGISGYVEAVTRYYYIDKTLLIRDFIDALPKVSLFTRPRRFGKTLNMDMLRVFFERTSADTSVYFKNKAIWA